LLNYIWLLLIVLGIASALYIDFSDLSSNKYHNNESFTLTLEFPSPVLKDTEAIYEGVAVIRAKDYNSLYGDSLERDFNVPVILTVDEKENKSNLSLKINDSTPDLWKKMAKASGNEDELVADINFILTDNTYKLS